MGFEPTKSRFLAVHVYQFHHAPINCCLVDFYLTPNSLGVEPFTRRLPIGRWEFSHRNFAPRQLFVSQTGHWKYSPQIEDVLHLHIFSTMSCRLAFVLFPSSFRKLILHLLSLTDRRDITTRVLKDYKSNGDVKGERVNG